MRKTSIFVTHDVREALRLGTEIAPAASWQTGSADHAGRIPEFERPGSARFLVHIYDALLIYCRKWRELTAEHLVLVLIAMAIAVAAGLPLGVLLTRRAALRTPLLGFANVMQTIPSLALFGFLIPIPFIGGIGKRTAIVALVLYALLPILRNTLAGILGVDAAVRESAMAMGMTGRQFLWEVELPLAAPTISPASASPP